MSSTKMFHVKNRIKPKANILIKPPFLFKKGVMCVYKLILEDRYFYIGATTCICGRMSTHVAAFKYNRKNDTLYTRKLIGVKILKISNSEKLVFKKEKDFIIKYASHNKILNKQIRNNVVIKDRELAKFICDGMDANEIAARKNIPRGAVYELMERLKVQAGAETLAGSVRYFFKQGWVS